LSSVHRGPYPFTERKSFLKKTYGELLKLKLKPIIARERLRIFIAVWVEAKRKSRFSGTSEDIFVRHVTKNGWWSLASSFAKTF
jgi:hypothetical protein